MGTQSAVGATSGRGPRIGNTMRPDPPTPASQDYVGRAASAALHASRSREGLPFSRLHEVAAASAANYLCVGCNNAVGDERAACHLSGFVSAVRHYSGRN